MDGHILAVNTTEIVYVYIILKEFFQCGIITESVDLGRIGNIYDGRILVKRTFYHKGSILEHQPAVVNDSAFRIDLLIYTEMALA